MLTYELAHPDSPILHTKTPEYVGSTSRLFTLAAGMFASMAHHRGIGLAAPQVGYCIRMFVIAFRNGERVACVNPVVLEVSEETCPFTEGCLSFPETTIETERPASIKVAYDDVILKKRVTRNLTGVDAICFQHELDHLNGITFHERAKSSLFDVSDVELAEH